MAVESLGNGLFEIGPRHLLLGQPFEQHSGLIEALRERLGDVLALVDRVLEVLEDLALA